MTDKISQPARVDNIEAIVAYFESGIKDGGSSVGIELEHTLLHENGDPVSYTDAEGQHLFLEMMSDGYPEKFFNQDGELIGLADSLCSVTLEPGSQVELSAGPFDDLHEAKRFFLGFEGSLAELVHPFGIEVLTPGYHPTRRAEQLKLLPKKRYEFMNRHFNTISPFGMCMMRGSASTQVSVDYFSVEDCLRKMRLANACVPLFSLICDNTPIFEARPRPHFLMRTEIWEKCDPTRCNLVPGVMDDDFDLERYAKYILDTPAIVAIEDGVEHYSTKTFGELHADNPMDAADVEHALSMFFTDIRLKKYIEIRPADAMPVEYAIAYAGLIKGLFYDDESLDAMDEMFGRVSAEDVWDAKKTLMTEAYGAHVYGRPVHDFISKLFDLSKGGLPAGEADLLNPLEKLAEGKVTLADLA